ncbi:MAG: hypothetical protein ACYS26_18730 [Planctomycetota bacterium]
MTTATALPHAASVVFQLGRVRRGRLAVRLVHAGLFAAGGAASLLGAAMSAGYEPNDGRVAGLVLLGALAAAVIYLGDTARGADNLAAELDRKLHRNGALLTAWQAERREPEAPFTRLLAEREASQLRGAQALRCCTPHWALAVIVPLMLFAWCASVAAGGCFAGRRPGRARTRRRAGSPSRPGRPTGPARGRAAAHGGACQALPSRGRSRDRGGAATRGRRAVGPGWLEP